MFLKKKPLLKSLLQESFKKYRNRITILCRLSKSNFYDKYFTFNQKNIRKVWEGVKSIISSRSTNTSSPTCINIDNNLVTDPLTIANSFNNYFASIADNIRKDIPYTTKQFSSFLKNPVPNTIFLSPSDDEEILHCILSCLDLKKSSEPSSIS